MIGSRVFSHKQTIMAKWRQVKGMIRDIEQDDGVLIFEIRSKKSLIQMRMT